jgi:hypothetical protein
MGVPSKSVGYNYFCLGLMTHDRWGICSGFKRIFISVRLLPFDRPRPAGPPRSPSAHAMSNVHINPPQPQPTKTPRLIDACPKLP